MMRPRCCTCGPTTHTRLDLLANRAVIGADSVLGWFAWVPRVHCSLCGHACQPFIDSVAVQFRDSDGNLSADEGVGFAVYTVSQEDYDDAVNLSSAAASYSALAATTRRRYWGGIEVGETGTRELLTPAGREGIVTPYDYQNRRLDALVVLYSRTDTGAADASETCSATVRHPVGVWPG